MAASPVQYAVSDTDMESGYASACSSEESLTEVYFTKPHLKYLNKQLQNLEPEDILKWAIISIPNLYQTTAFGLTGLVTMDMLSKLSTSSPIDLIFYDTLHHFSETLNLVSRVQARYPHIKLHIYQPQDADSEATFAAKYGAKLWETDDERYDWLAKVEPAQRAYAELGVKAILTGRRRSQGGKRGDLDIIEVDDAGIIKINPLANWSFGQVKAYVDEHQVPYNELLDMGYKSVGDWHSTQPVKEGEDERAGRWKGQEKTECGIHNSRSRYALFLMEQEQLRQQEELQKALSGVEAEEPVDETVLEMASRPVEVVGVLSPVVEVPVEAMVVEAPMAEVPVENLPVEVSMVEVPVETTVVDAQLVEAPSIETPTIETPSIDTQAEASKATTPAILDSPTVKSQELWLPLTPTSSKDALMTEAPAVQSS
ncbi:Phosphoadenosine phosphosulfate reductase thioredoxin [Microthyrium microscopicum]|uniref:phosphoadenylyl-sulfate reductase (thioredoxin) n=1 Tax=Microthyrium microscopicum TaxID=703497 RepID=A0A6A6USU9_9PEZI|nr:Phosphoadenosine phosphosulfate reductase thioredoxin [Microthyrium microscopicum]